MDDFRLKVFLAAARTLSFTRAAAQLCISQPAVSKHIRELESRYKVSLFDRCGSRLALTGAGETLLASAERLTEGYRRLEYEMSLCASRVEGELRLGASTTVAQYVLPPVLARFTARFPGVRVSMRSDNSDGVDRRCCTGRSTWASSKASAAARASTTPSSDTTNWSLWPVPAGRMHAWRR